MIPPAARKLIQDAEGFAATPYKCPAGKPTIGYGHVILAGEEFPWPLSVYEAEELFDRDLAPRESAVDRLVDVPLTAEMRGALVSFVYNLGEGALARSTLRRKLNAGDYEGAAHEFQRWVKAAGRTLPGLVARRAAEADLFRQGIEEARARLVEENR